MNNTTLVIIAIVAALGLVAIESISILQQQTEAQSVIGSCASSFKNSSASFCHQLR